MHALTDHADHTDHSWPALLLGARRLRVLHVTEALGGGVTTAIQAYIKLTPQFEHIILANRESPYYLRNWLDEQIAFVHLPSTSKLAQLRAVAVAVRALRPDVVHAHSSWAGMYARVLPVVAGRRVVYTPHCFAFERRDVGRVVRSAFAAVECLLGLRTGHLLANGTRELQLARRLRTVRRASSLLVTPWQAERVGTDRRDQARPAHQHDQFRVATCGRVVSQKGVDFFLDVVRAWSRLAEGTSARSVTWHWLGGGTPEAEQSLREAGVEVSGWLSQEEVVRRLSDMDAYLHTAEWEAGYPLALMEAVAMELPLVVRAIPALQDLPVPLVHTPGEAALQVCALLDEQGRNQAAARTRALNDRWHDPSDGARLAALYETVAGRQLAAR